MGTSHTLKTLYATCKVCCTHYCVQFYTPSKTKLPHCVSNKIFFHLWQQSRKHMYSYQSKLWILYMSLCLSFKCTNRLTLIFSCYLLLACDDDISGGLIWNSSRKNVTVYQPCSKLHPNFHSGVNTCLNNGSWASVDISNCTMFRDSFPVVVVFLTLTAESTNITDSDKSSQQC